MQGTIHTIEIVRSIWERENNTIYIASKDLKLPGLRKRIPGAGIFDKFAPHLQLTDLNARTRSQWELPGWFYPAGRTPLSYHGSMNRWKKLQRGTVSLRSVGRGQEFVLNCDEYPEAAEWLRNTIFQSAK